MCSSLTVAVVQPVCDPGDVSANAARHAAAVRGVNARLVVFPELSLSGYALDAPAIGADDDVLAPIVDACAERSAVALVGAPVLVARARYIAVLAVTATGASIAYRKTFLGDEEARVFSAGDGPRRLEVDGWWVGIGICKDTRVREHVDDTLSLGIDLYVAGLVHRPDEVRELDERAARIVERGRVPVAFASAAGHVGSPYPETAGRSCIWDEHGVVIARATAAPGDIARAALRVRA